MLPFFRPKRKAWMRAEDLAARHLKKQGYRILHRNIRLNQFEMDIVAKKGDTVVFVEVRSRSDDRFSAPEDTVQHRKQRHLKGAALRYIARYGEEDVYYRFDVIGILMPPGEKPQLTHIENAFTMDS
jgi:putative endonuclease